MKSVGSTPDCRYLKLILWQEYYFFLQHSRFKSKKQQAVQDDWKNSVFFHKKTN
jgi:hypothetical protein